MREIHFNPIPQVEIRIHVTEEMKEDFNECLAIHAANPDDEKDCSGCRWLNGMLKESGFPIRLCELPTVREKMKEVLENDSESRSDSNTPETHRHL